MHADLANGLGRLLLGLASGHEAGRDPEAAVTSRAVDAIGVVDQAGSDCTTLPSAP